jgi:hypothetical protein
MATYVRFNNTAVAVKLESTSGTDAFSVTPPDPALDFFRASLTPTFNQQQITVNEVTGSLDATPPIAGGTRVSLALSTLMRGSGTPATPPPWGKLMRVCAFKEIITATPVGAPTAATAGTATTATLQAPFAATSELYRGAPAVLSGNPATPFTTFITDYTAGRVATFGHSFNPVLSATTLATIPAHVRYEPTSDNTLFVTATVAVYMDGLLWKFTGCAGTVTVDLPDAGIGTLNFTLTGVYNAPTSTPTPTGIVLSSLQPPIYSNGVSQLNRTTARTDRLTLDAGVTSIYPENPEAPDGFDASTITARAIRGTIAPLMNVTDTIARANAFRLGGSQPLVAGWGSAAGNSFGVVVPQAQYIGYTPANRNGLMAETISFAALGQDSGAYIVAS